MGDMEWTYDSGNNRFVSSIADKYTAWNNVIADGFTMPNASSTTMSSDKMLKAARYDNSIYCTYFDAGSSVSDFVAAVSGTLIFYNKA